MPKHQGYTQSISAVSVSPSPPQYWSYCPWAWYHNKHCLLLVWYIGNALSRAMTMVPLNMILA